MIRDLITRNRSYRRFDESQSINRSTLCDLVELATLSPSAANLQPLRYVLVCDRQTNEQVFPHLSWAGYLRDWPGPAEGERPSAYIVMLNDTKTCRSVSSDQGIAAQSILLGAVEKGLGGCIIGSIDRQQLAQVLHIPERYEILLVIALGTPAEKVVVEEVEGDHIEYWRDSHDVHHVPKRTVEQVILP
jgi:nitroreductase